MDDEAKAMMKKLYEKFGEKLDKLDNLDKIDKLVDVLNDETKKKKST